MERGKAKKIEPKGSEPVKEPRDGKGRFLPGNSGGPGRTPGSRTAQLREEMFNVITRDEMRKVWQKILDQALAGCDKSQKLIVDRTLGPAVALDVLERLEDIERVAEKIGVKFDKP